MARADLANVKSELRSLLISSPVGLRLSDLLKDYNNNIGKPLPFADFGYLNPLEFLSSLPDVVKIQESFGRVTLLPVVVSKSAHVNQLVVKQRSNSSKKVNTRRSYINASSPANWKVKSHEPHSESENTPTSSQCSTKDAVPSQNGYLSTPEKKLEVDSMGKEGTNINPYGHSHDSIDWNLKKDISQEPLENDRDELNLTSKVKQNIREILNAHPHGLLLSRFPLKYKEKFLAPFTSQDYGLKSLKEFVLALPSIFQYDPYKCSNDWVLYDARKDPLKPDSDSDKWIPSNVLENMRKLVQKYPNGIYGNKVLELYEKKFGVALNIKTYGFESIGSFLVFCQSVDCKQEGDEIIVIPKQKKQEDETNPPAVPPLDELSFMWERYYTEDVCSLWFKYEPFTLPPGPFEFLKVKIADVLDPHNIWMQLLNKVQDIDFMMKELNVFYNEVEAHYIMNPNTVRDGHACVIQFSEDMQWHRAIITKVLSSTHVQVFYVDYGTQQIVSIPNLRYLHKKFSNLPIQVIRGEMDGLTWPSECDHWHVKTNEYICDMILGKSLAAQIVRIHIHEPKLDVILYDTSSSQDLCLNNILLNNGFAIRSSVPQVPDSSDLETVKSEETYEEEVLERKKEMRSYIVNGDTNEEITTSNMSSVTTETNDSDMVLIRKMTSTPVTYERNVVDSATITDHNLSVDESCQTNIDPVINNVCGLQDVVYNVKPVASNSEHLVVQQTHQPVMPVHDEGFNVPQDIKPCMDFQRSVSSLKSFPANKPFLNTRVPPPPGFEAMALDSITSFSSRLLNLTEELAEISTELLNYRLSSQLQQQQQPMQPLLAAPTLFNYHNTVPNGWETRGLQTPWVPSPYEHNNTQSYQVLPDSSVFNQGLPTNSVGYYHHAMNNNSTLPCTAEPNFTPVYRTPVKDIGNQGNGTDKFIVDDLERGCTISSNFTSGEINKTNMPVSRSLDFNPCGMKSLGTPTEFWRPNRVQQSTQPPHWNNTSPKRIKKIILLDRYLHVLRKGQSLYVIVDQLARTYSQYTTKLIIDYRIKSIKQDLQLIELTVHKYPHLFAELRMASIFGIKKFCDRLSLIPVSRTVDFLKALTPDSFHLFPAFELQKWELETLHTFYDIMKDCMNNQ